VSRIPTLRILVLAASASTKERTLDAIGGNSSEVLREYAVVGWHIVFLKFTAQWLRTCRLK
jgi:hypothetical protein